MAVVTAIVPPTTDAPSLKSPTITGSSSESIFSSILLIRSDVTNSSSIDTSDSIACSRPVSSGFSTNASTVAIFFCCSALAISLIVSSASHLLHFRYSRPFCVSVAGTGVCSTQSCPYAPSTAYCIFPHPTFLQV